MDGHSLAEVVGAACALIGITTVISIAIWQLAATRRAKVTVIREQEYRKLAERMTEAIEGGNAQLADLNSRLAKVQSQVDSMEKLLRDIE